MEKLFEGDCMKYKDKFQHWLDFAEGEIKSSLTSMSESEIEDAFFRDLVFGTGGLRGILGPGTNRMNIHVVARASQGISNYLHSREIGQPSVVIGFDSRLMSSEFAQVAAGVFAANDIRVYIWHELLPVPTVSYGIRALSASAGIMITASHNPAKYNGYKVYGADGCQITTEAATQILSEIDKLDYFEDVHEIGFQEGIEKGLISYISSTIFSDYIEKVKEQSVLFGDQVDKEVSIVYSPLNGTGLVPVTKILADSGYSNVTVVDEQKKPDGNFPTCPYPNPEVEEAMELGLEYCKRIGADLLIATDPDCDRCGIAVRDCENYRLLSGNEVGILLLDYICSQRIAHNKMPDNPVFIKTIVTTDLAEKIANHYKVETINVLTGFKYIGETIGRLEHLDRKNDFICGFEESYGYLTGAYVRDKDGVNAAFMICEMYAFYKTKGISLIEKLNKIYEEYGFSMNTLHSYQFEGISGMQQMSSIMANFRKGLEYIGGKKVLKFEDYNIGIKGLPKSDVLKFYFEDASLVIRPSGTEPKLKAYISVTSDEPKAAIDSEKRMVSDLEKAL